MSNKTSDNNKRIAKNTLLLYFRMFFMMMDNLALMHINNVNIKKIEEYVRQ